MQTQINCPNCQTPIVADIHQVIDVGRHPQLKQALLSGQLNVAACPNCGFVGQLSTPMVYHDPEHKLFMVHVPQQLGVQQMEREQLIGRLTQQVIDQLEPEQRKAYLLQPQQVLSMQTFMEKVLETEGITKEMVERQQKQTQLLQTLIQADKDVRDELIKERSSEIDETFFAMLRQYIDMASQMENDEQLVPLINLRAKLMTDTETGRQMEKRQVALHKLNAEAKKRDGLTPKLLLKHILKNLDDPQVMEALAMAGQGALSYEFFSSLTNQIEERRKKGEKISADRLANLRDKLLEYQEAMRQESQKLVELVNKTIRRITTADDKAQAVREHINAVDDSFMYVLSARIAQAEQQGNQAEAQALNEVHELIVREMESQMPPEIGLLNDLLEAETEAKQRQLLDENADLLSGDFVQMVDMVGKQAQQSGQDELNGRLQRIKGMLQARLAIAS